MDLLNKAKRYLNPQSQNNIWNTPFMRKIEKPLVGLQQKVLPQAVRLQRAIESPRSFSEVIPQVPQQVQKIPLFGALAREAREYPASLIRGTADVISDVGRIGGETIRKETPQYGTLKSAPIKLGMQLGSYINPEAGRQYGVSKEGMFENIAGSLEPPFRALAGKYALQHPLATAKFSGVSGLFGAGLTGAFNLPGLLQGTRKPSEVIGEMAQAGGEFTARGPMIQGIVRATDPYLATTLGKYSLPIQKFLSEKGLGGISQFAVRRGFPAALNVLQGVPVDVALGRKPLSPESIGTDILTGAVFPGQFGPAPRTTELDIPGRQGFKRAIDFVESPQGQRGAIDFNAKVGGKVSQPDPKFMAVFDKVAKGGKKALNSLTDEEYRIFGSYGGDAARDAGQNVPPGFGAWHDNTFKQPSSNLPAEELASRAKQYVDTGAVNDSKWNYTLKPQLREPGGALARQPDVAQAGVGDVKTIAQDISKTSDTLRPGQLVNIKSSTYGFKSSTEYNMGIPRTGRVVKLNPKSITLEAKQPIYENGNTVGYETKRFLVPREGSQFTADLSQFSEGQKFLADLDQPRVAQPPLYDVEQQAIRKFGTTNDPQKSLYITTDGKYLGNKGFEGGGEHANFTKEIFGKDFAKDGLPRYALPQKSGMIEIVDTGSKGELNVRIYTDPTEQQIAKLKEIVPNRESVYLDDYRGLDPKTQPPRSYTKDNINTFLNNTTTRVPQQPPLGDVTIPPKPFLAGEPSTAKDFEKVLETRFPTGDINADTGFITSSGKIVASGYPHEEALNKIGYHTIGQSGTTRFMKDSGAVRYVSDKEGSLNIEIRNKPTPEQIESLKTISPDKKVFIDIYRKGENVTFEEDIKAPIYGRQIIDIIQDAYKLSTTDFLKGIPEQPTRFLKTPEPPKPALPGEIESPAQEVLRQPQVPPVLPRGEEKQLISRMQESRKYPQDLREQLRGEYMPKTNKEVIDLAKSTVLIDPIAAERRALNPKNVLDQAIGAELFNYYMKRGDVTKANQIINATSGENEGQMIQILSQYDKTTPFGAKRFADNAIKAYNLLHPDRPINLTEVDTKSIYDLASKIQDMPFGRERNIASAKLMEQLNKLIPSSIVDKAITLWKAGLLTSLRTHERNLLGNLLHQTAEISKDIPASAVDRLMAMRTGQRSLTFTTKGLQEGVGKGFKAGKDIITTGFDPENAIAKFDIRQVNWGDNPLEQAVKKYTDTVFRALTAADKPFWNAAYMRSLYDQAITSATNAGKAQDPKYIRNLVDEPTEEMLKTAVKEANIATFRDKTVLSEIANAFKKVASQNEILKLGSEVIAPFTGVPSSIAKQMIEYSPIGLIKGIAQTGKVLIKDVPSLQREAAQEVGRGVIGTGLIGLGAYLASRGFITGQPSGIKESQQWQLEGKQANSILLPGLDGKWKWRSIGSIGPENLLILAGAKLQEEILQKQDPGRFLGSLGKDFLAQTFLQGIQQPLSAITDPARYGKSYIGNLASSVIPNILKDVGRAFDPYQREYATAKDYVTGNIPFLRSKNIVRRDVLGKPLPQEPSGIGAFFDLFYSKTPIQDELITELKRLNDAEINATPSQMAKAQTIHGTKVTLTPEQLDALEEQAGPKVRDALLSLIRSSEYKSMSDEEKANAISSTVTKVRTEIKKTVGLPGENIPYTIKEKKPTTKKKSSGFLQSKPLQLFK